MPGGMPGGAPGALVPMAGSVITVDISKPAIVLVPDVGRNRIIIVAPADVHLQIREWVVQLDQPRKVDEIFEVMSVEHADLEEVAGQITKMIENLPQGELKQGVRVLPFVQGRKILIFGSQTGRQIVKDLVLRMDLANSANRVTKVFELKNSDAEQVAKDIDSLYSSKYLAYESSYSKSWGNDPSIKGRIKVTADPRHNTVTVITDAVTMERVEKLIMDEWDRPIVADEVEPKIYTLRCADPVQVKDMLEGMFSKKQKNVSFFDMMFGGASSGGGESTTPVGRLFGQFSFQTLTNSNQLVVTTKNKANYTVIDRIIERLDQPQEAGLPVVVELKHANAEDLAEQLNAMLSEPGTPASILRQQRGLSVSSYSLTATQTPNNNQPNTGAANSQQTAAYNPAVMPFWWQNARPKDTEKPTSNLIGKIRIVPINRRNGLMIMAPVAYLQPITKLIEDLDQPGMQVMVHAFIVEITHDDVTTLGLRFASDPALLADTRLSDQSIRFSVSGDTKNEYPGFWGLGNDGSSVLKSNINIYFLLQALMEKLKLRVLYEPKIYTSDNQEAEFFDGQEVPYETSSQTSPEATSVFRQYEYKSVGTLLRVRPHITQQGNVDLKINLELSNIAQGTSVGGNFIFDRRETTTHVILQDGQTVLLSGIVRQEDFDDVRKFPLLGDLPGIGVLFRTVDKAKRNRELVAFITPHVIRSAAQSAERMKPDVESLEKLRQEMGTTTFGNRSVTSQPTSQPAGEENERPDLPPAEKPSRETPKAPEPTPAPDDDGLTGAFHAGRSAQVKP